MGRGKGSNHVYNYDSEPQMTLSHAMKGSDKHAIGIYIGASVNQIPNVLV